MSDLLRGLVTAAQSAATSGLSSYEDAAKRGRQQYNREQSQRRTKTQTNKETPEEYNRRKAEELVNGKSRPERKGKYHNESDIVRKITGNHNTQQIHNRGYNRG